MNNLSISFKDFFGFDVFSWIDGRTEKFVSLINMMLENKLINFYMVCTMTEILDITKEFRIFLTKSQHIQFLDALKMVNRDDVNDTWEYAATYIFLRTARKFIRQNPKFALGNSFISELANYDIQILNNSLANGVFPVALKILKMKPDTALQIFNKFGAMKIAEACMNFPETSLKNYLNGIVPKEFSNDILEFKSGKYIDTNEFRILIVQNDIIDALLDYHLFPELEYPDILDVIFKLPSNEVNECLFNANLIDFGCFIKSRKCSISFLDQLKEKTSPMIYSLIMTGFDGKYKINSADDAVLKKLQSQIARKTVLKALQ